MNKIAGYRKMLGMNQSDMASFFDISTQAYRMKERGNTEFKKEEMLLFRNYLREKIFPTITIDEIFFD